jgi:hypothetical protein
MQDMNVVIQNILRLPWAPSSQNNWLFYCIYDPKYLRNFLFIYFSRQMWPLHIYSSCYLVITWRITEHKILSSSFAYTASAMIAITSPGPWWGLAQFICTADYCLIIVRHYRCQCSSYLPTFDYKVYCANNSYFNPEIQEEMTQRWVS